MGTKVPGYERSQERKFPGTFVLREQMFPRMKVPGNFRSPRTKVPGNERSRERKFLNFRSWGTKVLHRDLSFLGTKGLGYEKTVIRIRQLADCQLADWMTRGLDISRTSQLAYYTTRGLDKSRTAQLADVTGDFACLVFVFWPFIDVFLRVYLNIYNTSDSVSCIMST